MKKLKARQGWVYVAVLIVMLFAIWYGVKSAPPNRFLNDTPPENVKGISFFSENGVYGENKILLQAATTDTDVIREVLNRLRQERFYYDAGGRTGAIGEIMLIHIDTDSDNVMLQLKKSKLGGADGTVTVNYQGETYFLERFSEKKELELYNSLFKLASELPQPRLSEYASASEQVLFEQRMNVESGVNFSTIDKVYDHADMVLSGRVTAVSLAEYSVDGGFAPQSTVTLDCEEVLKGTESGTVTFSVSGGVLPISRYIENDIAAEKMLRDRNLTDEQRENGFMRISMSKLPHFVEGDSYVVFLGQSADGSLYMTGLDYGALAVRDDVMTDFEGKTYSSTTFP